MTKSYAVNYTDTEDLAMQHAALDVQEWIDNAAHERARIAIEQIVQLAVAKCLENSIQVPGTKDEIVSLAFDRGWVKTAKQMNEEFNSQSSANT